MNTLEAETCRFGDVLDLIACEAISNGAKPKRRPVTNMETILFDMI